MRTFWLGLAVVTMAVAARASDKVDVRVGDWVKTTSTTTATGKSPNPTMTVLTRVKEISTIGPPPVSIKTATTDVTGTARIPGKDQPQTIFSITSSTPIPFATRSQNCDKDGVKVMVLEEGERTVVVNGVTFADVFYQKTKTTHAAKDDRPAREVVAETWDDGKTPLWILKRVTTTTPQGQASSTTTEERVAYGRAGDPIPGD